MEECGVECEARQNAPSVEGYTTEIGEVLRGMVKIEKKKKRPSLI